MARSAGATLPALRATSPYAGEALGTGITDCHSQCAHWLRNDTVCKGVQYKFEQRGEGTPPYGILRAKKSPRLAEYCRAWGNEKE